MIENFLRSAPGCCKDVCTAELTEERCLLIPEFLPQCLLETGYLL